MPTPMIPFRLERKHRDSLRALAHWFASQGRCEKPSEAAAVRLLIEDALTKLPKEFLRKTTSQG